MELTPNAGRVRKALLASRCGRTMTTQRALDLLRRVTGFMGTIPLGGAFVRTHHWWWSILVIAPVASACSLVTVTPNPLLSIWPPGKRVGAFAVAAVATVGMLPIYVSFVEHAQFTWVDLVVGVSSISVVVVISTRVVELIREELRPRGERN